jgi:hypothetical protein
VLAGFLGGLAPVPDFNALLKTDGADQAFDCGQL